MKLQNRQSEPVRTEDGLLNGYARHELPDGRIYEGSWKNGWPHGHGTMYFKGGSFEGEYVFGNPQGCGIMLMDDGFRGEGEYYGEQLVGHGKTSWSDGCTYEGEHADGSRGGYGVMVYPDGADMRVTGAMMSAAAGES